MCVGRRQVKFYFRSVKTLENPRIILGTIIDSLQLMKCLRSLLNWMFDPVSGVNGNAMIGSSVFIEILQLEITPIFFAW